MSKARTALTEFVQCGIEELRSFHTLDEETQELIVRRSCIKELDDDVLICKNHEDLLGNNFRQKVTLNRHCLWPTHIGRRSSSKNLRNPFPAASGDDVKQSLYLFSNHGFLVPFTSKICLNCKKDCCDKLIGFVEDGVRSPVINRRNLVLDDPQIEIPDSSQQSTTDFSQSTAHSAYTLPSSQRHQIKKQHLDSLIDASNITVKEDSCCSDWNSVGDRRQRDVLNYIGAGVASVIQTVVKDEDQGGLVYRKLMESDYVEKHLDSEVPISGMAKEIIKTANGQGCWDLQVQYISTLVGIPGINYKFLSQFNRKNRKNSGSSDESDSSSSSLEPCDNDDFFIFDFTMHMWISAVKLRKRFGYGMAPVIRQKNFKWFKGAEEVCDAVFDYIVSPLNTQRNSYGVINIKEESGEKSTIGRVIRHHRNSDMVKNIQEHLKGLGLPVPSSSFLFKFLALLPAASLKEMKGVNNTQEDAMRAYSALENVVETYASKCDLTDEEERNLNIRLSVSKTYLKTQYYNNLSVNDPIISHCVSCSVSDQDHKSKFFVPCEHDHKAEKCDKCELPYQTIDIMKALLHSYKNDNMLSEYQAAVIEKRLSDSYAAIFNYQTHLIKVYTQEQEWCRLMNEKDPQVAFYQGDWGMKILPRRHRGKQSEWFGQNGMSNHIGCFTRIIPNSYAEDETTPTSFRKQVTTYTSIVNDSSKQDALTTAAIIKENILAYKKIHPEVKKLYLQSDCAGCYKTNKLLQALYSLEIPDLTIMGYVFSAPCDGKSMCNTYAAIVKHHLTKMVSSGQMDITNPTELAKAISAASGIANVVVMIGTFDFRNDIYFSKIQKITELNTFSFLEDTVKVWKQGRYGTGHEISMKKIPFPSKFNCEIIGSESPRRNVKENLVYRMPGEIEVVEGSVEDFDDNLEELEGPIMEGSIYKCPNQNCDAEYLTLENFNKHKISQQCFQKIKLRNQSIGSHYQRRYIEMFGMNPNEKLSSSERRYKHMSWDTDSDSYSLVPSLLQNVIDTSVVFVKGFALITMRSKNKIHDDVREFVKEKFQDGETTNRHMSYPKIVDAIEKELDGDGNPRFFPNKWLDTQQVSYLISKFMKEKENRSGLDADNEPSEEDISVHLSEENFARRTDAIQSAIQNMEITKPLSEQCHPLLLEDGTNVCDVAKDYNENQVGKESWIMRRETFDELLPILNAIDYQPEGKSKRKAALKIVTFVKNTCQCIPKRRKKRN